MVRLRISHKLTLALAALLLATVAVAAVGISSLGDGDRRARALYDDNVRTTQATSAMGGGAGLAGHRPGPGPRPGAARWPSWAAPWT
jgi:hypothetical protein